MALCWVPFVILKTICWTWTVQLSSFSSLPPSREWWDFNWFLNDMCTLSSPPSKYLFLRWKLRRVWVYKLFQVVVLLIKMCFVSFGLCSSLCHIHYRKLIRWCFDWERYGNCVFWWQLFCFVGFLMPWSIISYKYVDVQIESTLASRVQITCSVWKRTWNWSSWKEFFTSLESCMELRY